MEILYSIVWRCSISVWAKWTKRSSTCICRIFCTSSDPPSPWWPVPRGRPLLGEAQDLGTRDTASRGNLPGRSVPVDETLRAARRAIPGSTAEPHLLLSRGRPVPPRRAGRLQGRSQPGSPGRGPSRFRPRRGGSEKLEDVRPRLGRELSRGGPAGAGTTVAVRVRHLGFWSLNACRIVYRVDDEGPIVRFGFA